MNAEKCDCPCVHSFHSRRPCRRLGRKPIAEWDAAPRKLMDASRAKEVSVGAIKPRSSLGGLLSLGILGRHGGKNVSPGSGR